MLVVEAYDAAVRMTIGRKNACFMNVKVSDLISQLVSGYTGISCYVDETGPVLKNVVQYYASDWDFLICRADINGMVTLVDQNKITVEKIDTSQSPVLGLAYGDSIMKFDLEIDARNQLTSVQSRSWDMSRQAVISATSEDPRLSVPGNISSSDLASAASPSSYLLQTVAPVGEESLQVWANALLTKSIMSKVRGTISFQGSARVNPGTLVTISGLGDRFNGNAYVSAVRHTLEDGNWITEVTVGVSPEWVTEAGENIMAPPASGLLPGIQGLQIGVVSKIDSDPENQFNVQVKIPLIDHSATVWARLATFYPTNNGKGSFSPEIGDQVVLGFLNEDPRYAVILGLLYGSGKPLA
jgi:phage protein D